MKVPSHEWGIDTNFRTNLIAVSRLLTRRIYMELTGKGIYILDIGLSFYMELVGNGIPATTLQLLLAYR